MKLSIITINLNNKEGLRRTAESVSSQTNTDFEWIVIDGGSTDGSCELIEHYSEHISYRVSELDKGIYNAMNKGIQMAKGEYLLFLNSGDCLFDECVVEHFLKSEHYASILSGIEYLPNENKYIHPVAESELTFDFLFDDVLRHQSTFISRSLLIKYGGYNERYRISSDWEFWLKALVVGNESYSTLPFVVSSFYSGGISCSTIWKETKEAEDKNVLFSILPRVYPNIIELRQVKEELKEYSFLKNGKCGTMVKCLLFLKTKKKQYHNGR